MAMKEVYWAMGGGFLGGAASFGGSYLDNYQAGDSDILTWKASDEGKIFKRYSTYVYGGLGILGIGLGIFAKKMKMDYRILAASAGTVTITKLAMVLLNDLVLNVPGEEGSKAMPYARKTRRTVNPAYARANRDLTPQDMSVGMSLMNPKY